MNRFIGWAGAILAGAGMWVALAAAVWTVLR